MEIGYLTRKDAVLSRFAKRYIELLREAVSAAER